MPRKRGPCNVSSSMTPLCSIIACAISVNMCLFRFKILIPQNDSSTSEDIDEEDLREAELCPDTAVATTEHGTASDVEDNEEKAEGLEAGEAAALVKRKKVPPKPVQVCLTLNRYSPLNNSDYISTHKNVMFLSDIQFC